MVFIFSESYIHHLDLRESLSVLRYGNTINRVKDPVKKSTQGLSFNVWLP